MPISKDQKVEFLARVASGRSVRDVCTDEDMPPRFAIYELLASDTFFADQYARACEMRADQVFDEIFEIADDARNDWMDRRGEGDAGWAENGEALRRSALRIDVRKWALARMSPRKYGDKLAIGGAADLPPIQTEEVVRDADDFARRVAGLAARSAGAGTGADDAGGEGGA